MSKTVSTFDRMMQDADFKDKFDEGYEEFLISEKICEAMNEMDLSVRQLAEKAHVSKTTIMNLRTGDAQKISVRKLNNILHILNYKLSMEKVSTANML
jgi:DNA-binding Xre family transcriptional regulator